MKNILKQILEELKAINKKLDARTPSNLDIAEAIEGSVITALHEASSKSMTEEELNYLKEAADQGFLGYQNRKP